ncbi:hypothetical protein AMECASPLE_025539 [Ameca splendens]|uniref:Uncharacterized protein n=1 Tax=Ameca splendens TaxID=208324 RepID=A0ABV0XTP9_9TELE
MVKKPSSQKLLCASKTTLLGRTYLTEATPVLSSQTPHLHSPWRFYFSPQSTETNKPTARSDYLHATTHPEQSNLPYHRWRCSSLGLTPASSLVMSFPLAREMFSGEVGSCTGFL